jgi:hypothetical protein
MLSLRLPTNTSKNQSKVINKNMNMGVIMREGQKRINMIRQVPRRVAVTTELKKSGNHNQRMAIHILSIELIQIK